MIATLGVKSAYTSAKDAPDRAYLMLSVLHSYLHLAISSTHAS